MIDLIVAVINLIIILLVPIAVIFMLIGMFVIYAGSRFKKSAKAADKTAFYAHWLVFIWSWAEQSDSIVAAFPFFKQDLTETFGVRPDDGRIT